MNLIQRTSVCLTVPLLLLASGLSQAEEQPVGLLVKLGIETNEKKVVTKIFDEVVPIAELTNSVGRFVLETDKRCRARAVERGKSPNSIATLAGTWMEYSLMVALKERGRTPLYWQTEFEGFKDNFFDIVLFTKEYGPVVLSPKTSLRERYKQADLEAHALRNLFPKSKFYLLSLDTDKNHIANIRRKIADGDIKGINALYDETNLDELFNELAPLTLVEPEPKALRRGRLIR
jgi:hypothetical protein